VVGSEGVVAADGGADVAAEQQRVDSEPVHQVELRARAAEILAQPVTADALEVAERLVQIEGQSEIGGQPCDALWRQ
jgi:hypothetical protein